MTEPLWVDGEAGANSDPFAGSGQARNQQAARLARAASHKSSSDETKAIACQLVPEEGPVWTSGALGLTSPDGVISSAWDLRFAAFSTSSAASSGFPVARAKFNSAIA
jgi:hypothetical protein